MKMKSMTLKDLQSFVGILYFGGIRCDVKNGSATFSYDNWSKDWGHYLGKKYITRKIRQTEYGTFYIKYNFTEYRCYDICDYRYTLG